MLMKSIWWSSIFAIVMAVSLVSNLAYADGNKPGGKGAAGARPSPEMMQKIIAKFDKDGDGKLNESERQAARAARGTGQPDGVAKGGANGAAKGTGRPDGELMKKVIERFDQDGDGKLNESERQAARAAKGSFAGAGAKAGQKKPLSK